MVNIGSTYREPSETVKKHFAEIVDFDEYMSQEEVYVLACAGAYAMNNI